MKVRATTLPRKSASATGLPSCEVKVNGGAGPITGSGLSPPAARAPSDAGTTSNANARTTAIPPLTSPLRGPLPLPSGGEMAGVRGTFSFIRTSLSRLQLALQLIEQAKIGAVGDDALRVVLDHTELMHAQCIKPDRVLGIVVAPKIVGDFGDGLQRVVVARGKAAIDEQPRGLFGRTGAEVGGF